MIALASYACIHMEIYSLPLSPSWMQAGNTIFDMSNSS